MSPGGFIAIGAPAILFGSLAVGSCRAIKAERRERARQARALTNECETLRRAARRQVTVVQPRSGQPVPTAHQLAQTPGFDPRELWARAEVAYLEEQFALPDADPERGF